MMCDFCKDNEYNINWYNRFKYKDKYGNYKCPCRCNRGYASEHDGQCSKCRTNDQQYKFDTHRKELIKQELL